MKWIIIFFLLFLPGVLAFEVNSSDKFLSGDFVNGVGNFSNGGFKLDVAVGEPVVGRLEAGGFVLTLGVFGPAEFLESPVPSGTGAGAGGAGCAEGFWKNEFGECVWLEGVPVVEPVDKQNYLPYLLLGSGVVIFVFAYLRNERKREIDRRAKEMVKENETFK